MATVLATALPLDWTDTMSQHRSLRVCLPSLVALTVLVSAMGMGCSSPNAPSPEHRPALIFDESVGSDLQALALETWDRFLAVFQGRSGCFGDVHVRAAYQLDSRAGYDPDSATVTVRVPGTPAKLQSALVHEWAHHVEFQCPEHQALRPAFLAAQGLPPDTLWRPDQVSVTMPAGEWAGIPSEQYAEATIEAVLGKRPIPTTARVTREAVRVIEEWATGN
jgi:hypothetical protein